MLKKIMMVCWREESKIYFYYATCWQILFVKWLWMGLERCCVLGETSGYSASCGSTAITGKNTREDYWHAQLQIMSMDQACIIQSFDKSQVRSMLCLYYIFGSIFGQIIYMNEAHFYIILCLWIKLRSGLWMGQAVWRISGMIHLGPLVNYVHPQ